MTAPARGHTADSHRRDRLPLAVNMVTRALRAHGGGAELVEFTERGESSDVTLRLTGLCRGCPYWPVTLQTTIAPLLRRELGEVNVDIDGRRISEAAMGRMLSLTAVPRLPPIDPSTAETDGGATDAG